LDIAIIDFNRALKLNPDNAVEKSLLEETQGFSTE